MANPPRSHPSQDFLKLLDALDPWLLHERRCGAEAGDESKCDCGISAARQSLVDYVEGIRAERDRLRAELMHLKLESARERVAPLVEEAKLAASKERRL